MRGPLTWLVAPSPSRSARTDACADHHSGRQIYSSVSWSGANYRDISAEASAVVPNSVDSSVARGVQAGA